MDADLTIQAMLLCSLDVSVVAVDPGYRVIFWNGRAHLMFGYTADEAIGRPIADLILPIETPHCEDVLSELKLQRRWQGRRLRRRKDGSMFWADIVSSTTRNSAKEFCGYVSIYRDISEHKEAEDRLRFQAQLLDSVRESVMALDTEGTVIFWGCGAELLFGYSKTEALNLQMTSLIYPASAGGMKEWRRIRDHVFEGHWWNKEVTRCRKDGSEFCADVAAAPIRDEAGSPIGLVAIHRDITERQRDQEMVRESHERLRHLTSRLMAIREQERSAIARELHDELGQALTRLNIDLRSLMSRLPARLKDARTTSLVPFVDDLLGKVQHISAQLRPAILDDLGLEAAIEWQVNEFARWNKGMHCSIQLSINSLKPQAERDTAVFRIVQEALTNIARHARAKRVRVQAVIRGGELSVDIADNGVGIPDLKMLNGHSLGIVGMRERAENIGGRLTLALRNPMGTIVSLRVPLTRMHLADVS